MSRFGLVALEGRHPLGISASYSDRAKVDRIEALSRHHCVGRRRIGRIRECYDGVSRLRMV